MLDGTGAAGPRIERVSAKVATLERRIDWLRRRIGERDRNERQVSFDVAEVDALEAGIVALRYHRAALDADTDPVLALAELLDATEVAQGSGSVHALQRLEEARGRARRVLRELTPDD